MGMAAIAHSPSRDSRAEPRREDVEWRRDGRNGTRAFSRRLAEQRERESAFRKRRDDLRQSACDTRRRHRHRLIHLRFCETRSSRRERENHFATIGSNLLNRTETRQTGRTLQIPPAAKTHREWRRAISRREKYSSRNYGRWAERDGLCFPWQNVALRSR